MKKIQKNKRKNKKKEPFSFSISKQKWWCCYHSSAGSVEIRNLVPVEGNKSLPLICSPAELLGPISRLLSWCPHKPQHCMSCLGLIRVCPPREGSMAAGPSPTLDRPLLGTPLGLFYLELSHYLCLSFTFFPFSSHSLILPMSWQI